MEIRETNLMILCVQVAKTFRGGEYTLEVTDAMERITNTMFEAGPRGEVTVARMANDPNPVDMDIAGRMFADTVGLILGLEER